MKSYLDIGEQGLRSLLGSMPQIVFIARPDGEVLYFNEKWYEYTGLDVGDISIESRQPVFYPDEYQSVRDAWIKARDDQMSWTQEYRLRRHDGTYRWHLGRSVPQQNSNGEVTHWIGTMTDIENQKNAEVNLEQKVQERTKELSQTNSFLDAVIENIPNMIFVKEAQNLKFVRFNKAGEQLIGLSREELIGKNDFDFFPPEQAQAFQEKDRFVIKGQTVVDIPEEQIDTKNGQRILHSKKIPVFDNNGEPKYLLGISEDITDVKKLESERLQLIEAQAEKKETERNTERFKFLAEASALLGSTLDYEEILKNLTKLSVPSIADWCSVELLQTDRSLKQIAVAHKDPEKIKWAWELRDKYPPDPKASTGSPNVVQTGRAEMVSEIPHELLEAVAIDKEHLKILDAIGFKSYICAPIRARGHILGTLTLVTTEESGRIYSQSDLHLAEDIGERAGAAVENAQLYKESRNLNRIKDEFLATLSHELRTPLNVILGHAEILKSEAKDLSPAELKSSIDAIYRNAKTQTGLIADLLDVSSIITGKVSYKPGRVSPAEIVDNISASLKNTAEAKGVTLVCMTENAPPTVYADATRLHQIIWNLMANAIKFTHQGGQVTVQISQSQNDWEIVVSDTGRGIDPEFLPYVFDRFRQEDATTTRRYGGLGLGLSIVRHLVELHGGHVLAVSKGKDLGSTFRVILPLNPINIETDKAKSPLKVKENEIIAKQKNSLKDVKILLVEDSEDSRKLIQLMLSRAGAITVEAESAEQAREKLIEFTPNVIISDVGMPEENGIEFMKQLRATFSKDQKIPAIALTAYVRPEEKISALEAGFQAHLGKPIASGLLISEIQKVLGLQH